MSKGTNAFEWHPYPLHLLPEPIREYVEVGATAIGCDPAMTANPVLGVVAGCVGTTRWVQLKRGWAEPCVLWCPIVAPSGTLKSPAQDLATEVLQRLQQDRFSEHGNARQKYERDLQRHEADKADWRRKQTQERGEPPTKPEAPACVRYAVADVTAEALAPILASNPRGVILIRDELGAWLTSFNQYKSGKGSDVQNWIEAYRAGPWTIDRKTSGTIHIPRAAVSVVGMIQPKILQRLLTAEFYDCGFAARLLIVAPPTPVKRWTDRTVPVEVTLRYETVVERLLSLQHDRAGDGVHPVYVGLTPSAQVVWRQWYNRFAERQAETDGHLAAALAKLEGAAARLALIFCLVRWADSRAVRESPIDVPDIRAGVELVEWYAIEAVRVYGLLAESAESGARRQLADYIRDRGGVITVRELSRGGRQYRGNGQAREALDALVRAGLGSWEHPAPGTDGGHPAEVFQLRSDGGDGDETPDCGPRLEVVSPSPVSPAVTHAAMNGGADDVGNREVVEL